MQNYFINNEWNFCLLNSFILSKNYLFLCALKIEGLVAEW